MLVECIAWVFAGLHLLYPRRGRNKGLAHFPDDVLIDILSWLPADAIQRCRRVCRHWRTLTSSTYFIHLQSQRAPSGLVRVDMAALEMSISKYEKAAYELKREHAALVARADNGITELRRSVRQMFVVIIGLAINYHLRKSVERGTLILMVLCLLAMSLLQGLTYFMMRFQDIGTDLEYVLKRKEAAREELTRWLDGLNSDQAAVLGPLVVRLQRPLDGFGDFKRGYYLQAFFTSFMAVFPLVLMFLFI